MDEILYILIGIGWVAFGLYKNYQKQLKAQKSKASAPKIEREETSVKDIFEELFPFEEIRTKEQEGQEVIFDDFESLEEIKISDKKDIKVVEKQELKEDKEIIRAGKQYENTEFDLRKAVIYSMILERPYN